MNERTVFLREQTISGANKCARAPLPPELSTANLPLSLAERKAAGLKLMFEKMPVYIGEQELIVGTRTWYTPNPGNEDGHDPFDYALKAGIPYVNEEDVKLFGGNEEWRNKTHYTPDFTILLNKGIGGIIQDAENRSQDPELTPYQREFLSSLTLAYQGLSCLIERYAAAAEEKGEDEIARVCHKVALQAPDTLREAIQLLWFGLLGTIIESFKFINYGRLDVLFQPYLKDTSYEEARELVECLLLKMYDQVDLNTTYLKKYSAQLVVTLGGVLPNGENAVGDMTMIFLDAIDFVRLPEPEFNLRISTQNPASFKERAAELTLSGCNFISYYNDELIVKNLHKMGIALEDARSFGFGLCQDVVIPGRSDNSLLLSISLAHIMLEVLDEKTDYPTFDELLQEFKHQMDVRMRGLLGDYNTWHRHMLMYPEQRDRYFDAIHNEKLPIGCSGKSPMCPLPFLSGLFHGAIENARDVVFACYPIKVRAAVMGTAVEGINSLAAIRHVVYDKKLYTLQQVAEACKADYQGKDMEVLRSILWNAPKWGNDNDEVDLLAKEVLEFGLKVILDFRTEDGERYMSGIHQAHPVRKGEGLAATPEGRHAGCPVSVTMTPENGSVIAGPTALLRSVLKLDPNLLIWNFCVMSNYYQSVFSGNDGKKIFLDLLDTFFKNGGYQHQPQIQDVNALKAAQLEPEKYKDLIVRLWGVSAHFVDLPKELQDEIIARFL